MKTLTLAAMLTLVFSITGLSEAEAADISTTETTVAYARQALTRVMGAEYSLVPGSIQISLRQETIMDIGGAVRAVFGNEKVEYEVNFKATDRARDVFSGRTFLTIQAVDSTSADPEQDNNTTLRGKDPGTNRLIKVQLFEYQNFPQPIDVKSLELRKLKVVR